VKIGTSQSLLFSVDFGCRSWIPKFSSASDSKESTSLFDSLYGVLVLDTVKKLIYTT